MLRLPGFLLRSGFKALAVYLLLQVSAPAGAACIPLAGVDIEVDDGQLPAATRRELIDPLLGSCIDTALLRDILSRISGYFIDNGYVTTRPYLLEQDINDGQVEIRVLVGTIEAIVDADTGASNRKIATAFLFNDDVLNLRELESSLEMIERADSVQAEFEIRPGTRQGSSVIAIRTVETNPLSLELGANAQTDLDSRLSFQAGFDNPLDINDILTLRFNSGDVRETYQSNSSRELAYSFPLGAYLVEFSHSDVSYTQRIQGVNDSFVADGDTLADQLGVSRVIARTRASRLSLGLSLKLEDTRNFLEGELIEVSSYKTSQLQLELRHDWYRPWGQLVTRYIFHQGLDSFGARDDEFYTRGGAPGSEARLQFEKLSLDSRLLVYLADPRWQLSHNLHLQYSDDILFDSDKLNLGGPYTVRGYASALSGGNAWYLRSDITRQMQTVVDSDSAGNLAKMIALSLGVDYGEVECAADNADACGEIYGVGLGLLFRDANFSGRLLWGHPLKELGDDSGREDQYLLDLRWVL